MWDAFGDADTKGLLRNKFGVTKPTELSRLEFVIVTARMGQALSVLSRERDVDLRSWRRAHKVLFGDIYPWAGTLREIDVNRGPVWFNVPKRIDVDAALVFEDARQPGYLKDNLGYVYGELAFSHPFLDGNGRSLNSVFSELCRRQGFALAWDKFDRETYLRQLTKAVSLRDYGGLQDYLTFHLIGTEDLDRTKERLVKIGA